MSLTACTTLAPTISVTPTTLRYITRQVLNMTNEETLPLSDVLTALLKETETSAGMRGAEERDLLLGRLFGLGCCARSGRDFSPETTALLTRQLLDLHLKRKWMKEATLGVLADLLDQVRKRIIVHEHFTMTAVPLTLSTFAPNPA